MDYPSYHPVHEAQVERPIKAVFMDLDGTTVHSEYFRIWMIEKATAACRGIRSSGSRPATNSNDWKLTRKRKDETI